LVPIPKWKRPHDFPEVKMQFVEVLVWEAARQCRIARLMNNCRILSIEKLCFVRFRRFLRVPDHTPRLGNNLAILVFRSKRQIASLQLRHVSDNIIWWLNLDAWWLEANWKTDACLAWSEGDRRLQSIVAIYNSFYQNIALTMAR
jgi:hypothetical protein